MVDCCCLWQIEEQLLIHTPGFSYGSQSSRTGSDLGRKAHSSSGEDLSVDCPEQHIFLSRVFDLEHSDDNLEEFILEFVLHCNHSAWFQFLLCVFFVVHFGSETVSGEGLGKKTAARVSVERRHLSEGVC